MLIRLYLRRTKLDFFLRLWYIVTAGPVVNKELLGGIMPDKKVQNLFR